jgi:hypothetical protein
MFTLLLNMEGEEGEGGGGKTRLVEVTANSKQEHIVRMSPPGKLVICFGGIPNPESIEY